MPIPDTQGVPPWATFDDIKSKINELVAKYNNLLVNLDTLNVVSLDAKVVNTGVLNADKVTIRSDLTAGAYIQIDGNGMVVNNGTFDTFTVDINGNVTMTSALIMSSTSYPRVEMNPTSNYFRASETATNYAEISYNALGAPSLNFFANGIIDGEISADIAITPAFNISSNRILNLICGVGHYVQVPNWSQFNSLGSGTDLQTELNSKADTFSGYTGSFSTGTQTVNVANGIITSVV